MPLNMVRSTHNCFPSVRSQTCRNATDITLVRFRYSTISDTAQDSTGLIIESITAVPIAAVDYHLANLGIIL